MKTLNVTTLKTATVTAIIAVLLTVTIGCVTTPGYNAYGDIYKEVYEDNDLYKKHKKTIKSINKDLYQPAIEQAAANKVSNMGYHIKDVKYKKGNRTITVKAERGREDYKIELGYPDYNMINIKKN